MEGLVKLVEHLAPLQLPLGYLVKVLFNFGGEMQVEDVWEICLEKVRDEHAYIRWEEFGLLGAGILGLFSFADVAIH